jgi:hypothetical protein
MSSFEFENSKRPEDPVLDAMLDAMLGEWLGGEAVRGDVSSKAFDPGEMYLSVLKRSEASVFTDEQHAQAVLRAQRESLPEGLPEDLPETGQDRSHGASARPLWRSAAIAASIAVSIGGLSLIGRWVQRDLDEPVGVGQASLDGAPSTGPRVAEPTANASQGVVVADSQSTGSQSLESQVLPEQGLSTRTDSVIADGGLDPARREPMQDKLAVGRQSVGNQEQGGAQDPVQGAEMASALPSARVLSLGTLEDREIVSVIDSQFQQIWKSLGMPQSDMVSGGQASLKKRGLTADRIARLLLHRVATDSELEAIRLDKLSEDSSLERLVASWISSDEFDRVWSARLANFYMGGRIESSQQAVVFREWLATQIRDDVPLEQVQRQVLLGLSQADHPAYFLVDYWSDRGDRWSLPPNSPQVAWVGYGDSEVKRLEGLSHLFLKVTSNPAMACTQCHGTEGTSAPSWFADRVAMGTGSGGGLVGSKSVDFDSIAALMVGIAQPGVSELFQRQQDDQVRKIAARFPDGKRVGSELSFEQAIDGWLEQGSHSQSGLLNALWRDFFGVGLDSAFGLDGAVALEARRDLVGYLGKQVVERGAGLRRVVYWMLMSDPARQAEESLTYAQFMVMDAQRLQDYLQRQAVFKTLLLDDSRSAVRDEAWLVGYASALFPEQAEGLERSFLAQPSNQVQGGNKRASSAGQAVQWPGGLRQAELGYRAAGDRARRWAGLLSASELSQSALIDHAYLMTKHRFATAREIRAWSSTSWTKSERSSAVLRLLMGVASLEP